MQTVNVVLSVLNKNIVKQIGYTRRGPKGYGLQKILRLLLYSVLAEVFSTRQLIKHLRKNPKILRKLGFTKLPVRRAIDGWFEKYDFLLSQVIGLTGDQYLQLNESEWTILDSTPIRHKEDPDAKKGYSSQGEFWGFKVHLSCDEYCVPLRACFTTGNIHDSKPAIDLLAPTLRVGGDAAYDFDELKYATFVQGSLYDFVHNPRREGKEKKKPTSERLKRVRVRVEQCNSILKEQVLKRTWTKVKGYAKKATRCLLGVLAIQALAIANLKKWGYPSVRITDLRA